MALCQTCHEYFPTQDVVTHPESHQHQCPPAWLVWDPDQGETMEEADTVYAFNSEWAVEKWAEQDDNDSAEYSIARGVSAVVCVQPKQGGPVEKYKVSGEYQPTYSAELIEEGA